jgi:hypothetical protein
MPAPSALLRETSDSVRPQPKGVIIKQLGSFEWHSITYAEPAVYHAASPIFSRQTEFGFDMDCESVLAFLRSVPPPFLRSIRSIYLGRQIASPHLSNSCVDQLGRFILEDMDLKSITLPLPDDRNYCVKDEDDIEDDYCKWDFHKAVIHAFKRGWFHEVRFAYPKRYFKNPENEELSQNYNNEKPNVFSLYIVGFEIEEMLLGLSPLLEELRDRYSEGNLERPDGNPCQEPIEALHEHLREIWKLVGYTIEHDDCRMDETGTVLVLRRVGESLKRPAADELDQDARRQR